MGSGVLLAALVVLWFVVLVPMVVTRGDERTRPVAGNSGRTLQRRRVVDPVVHASTERVEIDRGELLETGELRVDVHAVRRRTLAGLAGLAVLALVGAVLVVRGRARAWILLAVVSVVLVLCLLGTAVLFGALGLGAVVAQTLLLLVGPLGCLVLAVRRPVREWTGPAWATRAPQRGRRTQRTG